MRTPTERENARLFRYIQTLGAVRGRCLYGLERLGLRQTVTIHYPAGPLRLRLNTTDILVLYTIFVRQDYSLNLQTPPGFIVDAGAYTGFSPIYFARKYPGARIVAIEPHPGNFELLQKNTAGYPQITPIHKALWFENTRLDLYDRGTGNWGYAAGLDGSGFQKLDQVDTITIDRILQEFDTEAIDLLKLDIEGAEKQVLSNSTAWIGSVNVIAAELHDRIQAGASQAFEAATRDFAFGRQNQMTVFRSRNGKV